MCMSVRACVRERYERIIMKKVNEPAPHAVSCSDIKKV